MGFVTAALVLGMQPSVAGAGKRAKRIEKQARKALRARKLRRFRKVRYPLPRRDLSPFKLRLPASASPEEILTRRIEYLWSAKILAPGTTAVLIKDAATGKVLYSTHAKDKLNPASNVKLIATAAALDALGARWRYVTRLYGAAPDRSGVVRGDLYLRGNFDPTLGSRGVRDLAATLAARGITRIHGDVVIGHHSHRDGIGRPWVWLKVQGADKPGEPPTVTIAPESDFVEVDVTAKTIYKRRPKLQVKTKRVDEPSDHYRIEVSGSIRPRQIRRYRRWISDRPLYTAHILERALSEAGVELTGGVRQQAFADYLADAGSRGIVPIELAVHRSAPLSKLVATINKRSLNYLADRVIMTAGAVVYGGEPTMEKGIKVMHNWLSVRAKIDPKNVVIDTGSGLSYSTELSAEHIVRVLRVAAGFASRDGKDETHEGSSQLEDVYLKSLSVAGVDGTLRGRYRDSKLRGKVFGKTGTLRRVIATSGVVKSKRGALVFSIVTNGTPSWWRYRVRKQHDWMIKSMYEYLRTRPSAPDSAVDGAERTAAKE